jgi:hypothetical protein
MKALGVVWTLGMLAMLRSGQWLVRRWAFAESNCLLWALREMELHGGHIEVVKSSYGWWFHIIHVKDGVRREFNPVWKKQKRRLPPLLFSGRVRRLHGTVGE